MSAKNTGTFSDDERKAMVARAKELKALEKAEKNRAAGEKLVLDVIKSLPEPDKSLAKKIHEIVSKVAPHLWPKTFYGFPAYANNDKVVVFFQFASKFKTRYSTVTFDQTANLDEGNMWPVSFAVTKITAAEEKKIEELVKKAVS